MPGGLGWRHCLIAFLLFVGRAEFSSDLRQDSRSGDISNIDSDSNEFSEEVIEENRNEDALETIADITLDNGVQISIKDQEYLSPFSPPGPLPDMIPAESNIMVDNNGKSEHLFSDSEETPSPDSFYNQIQNLGGAVLRENSMLPNDPNYDHEIVYPVNGAEHNTADSQRVFSKLISLEHHISLHKIPGAQNAIQCKKEGELHNLWAPSSQCMVCVCLSAYGILSPVCVSCFTCSVSPGPPPRPTPSYTTPGSLRPSTTVPDQVSCKPLPANIPFQSPLDPCKICVCTETSTEWGTLDVQIHCQHNPQCVLPSYQTSRPPTPTPIPLPVCNQFPQNVPFPHPDDKCKLCKCTTTASMYGTTEQEIDCYINPECQSTIEPETPEPQTESPGPFPDKEICDSYPDNVIFPNPLDNCQVCKCTVHPSLIFDNKKVTCYLRPNCIPSTLEPITETSLAPQPSCEGYPENLMFPHPTETCKICKCVREGHYFNRNKTLICYLRPQCVPTARPTLEPLVPSTTVQPELTYLCDRYPLDVMFPHPSDPCRSCQCYTNLYQKNKQITCFLRPECSPTLKPPQTSPEPTVVPDNVSCKPLPSGTPFPNPLNPCQTCICTERADLLGRLDVNIECQENYQCVLPPDHTALSPDLIDPTPLAECKLFPENVLFPHPHDICLMCKCTVETNSPYGKPEGTISCIARPECSSPRPTPVPVSTLKPTPGPDKESCAPFPTGKPFQNPLHPCQICTCTERADLFGRHDINIECEENPQCVTPSDVTTLPLVVSTPIPFPACKEFPENVWFPHPEDACQLCKCTIQGQLPNSSPEEVISCVVRSECGSTQLPPPTEDPVPLDLCELQALNVPFTNPSDPCQLCVCILEPEPLSPSGLSLTPQVPEMKAYHRCIPKPECSPPSPDHMVTTTSAPRPGPRPQPDSVLCKPLPSGTPFQNPINPCQVCVCKETVDVFGRPDVSIKCQENPNCIIPPAVTTIRPTPSPSTIAPLEPSLCDQYPPNALFPLPQDKCRLCRCSVERNLYGGIKKQIHCFTNPNCSPKPSAPPGPLPGPAPHESCAPYEPDMSFQHPWDECQICVCTQAISTDRITIEVNCYTKPSCCVELPIDVTGLPGQSGFPAITGSPGERPIVIGPGSVKSEESGSGIFRPKPPGYIITGGSLVEPSSPKWIGSADVDGPFNGNLFVPGSEKNTHRQIYNLWSGSTESSLLDATGENWIGPVNDKSISSTIRNDGSLGVKIIETPGPSWINDNTFESPNGNLVSPNMYVEEYRPYENLINPKLSDIRHTENFYGTNLGNLFNDRLTKNTVVSNHGGHGDHWRGYETFTKSENMVGKQIYGAKYVPSIKHLHSGDPKHIFISPYLKFKESEPSDFYMDTKAMAEASAQDHGSNAHAEVPVSAWHTKSSTKMRTKTGRPNDDNNSEDYD